MTPSSILIHHNFKFHDGEIGDKFLIILGSSHGKSLLVKTTSRGKHYSIKHGCQIYDRFPNFHLAKGCCYFDKPTWVCLDEFYILKDSELLARHFQGDVHRCALLPDEIYIALIKCSIESDDISEIQARIIKESLLRDKGLEL